MCICIVWCPAARSGLTDAGIRREVIICKMILNGLINKEIAEDLSVSEHTVEKFRHNIRKKLGLTGRKINLQSYLQSLLIL